MAVFVFALYNEHCWWASDVGWCFHAPMTNFVGAGQSLHPTCRHGTEPMLYIKPHQQAL